MPDLNKTLEPCSICKNGYTTIHLESVSGWKIYVCKSCIEATKYNFIWICLNCGEIYIRPKSLTIKNINDYELRKAYTQCADMKTIQGLDMCIECDPHELFNGMNVMKTEAQC
ncbi:MAG: hypothetical protein V3R54_05820 [Thermodesulfovibrionia bacterium]